MAFILHSATRDHNIELKLLCKLFGGIYCEFVTTAGPQTLQVLDPLLR